MAWVRTVPDAYARCLRTTTGDIDVERARRQHGAYVEALRAAGLEVIALPPLHDAPDSVFVEDPAVLLEGRALLTRPGAPSRRGEGATIGPALSVGDLEVMAAPATLDGGDVLRLGIRLFVGRTERTNDAGIARLSEFAARSGFETIPVSVRAGLHLKSAVTPVGEAVIGLFDRVDGEPFRARGVELIDAPELHGANVLDLGASVLVSAAAPRTAERLRGRGCEVVVLDVGELHKGDGALTCLSIRA